MRRMLKCLLAALCIAMVLMLPAAQAEDGTAWMDELCPVGEGGFHFFEWEDIQREDCTHGAITAVYCRYCGKRHTAYDPAPGHQWDEGKVTKEPTCTEAGERTYTCTRLITNIGCGATYTETIPALGHDPETISGKAATCTESGLTEGSRCKRCGGTVKAQETIPALGHSWDGGKVTKEPTCTAAGEKTYTCTRCGATRKDSVPVLGHAEQAVSGRAATCTEAGLTEGSKCSRCGATLKAQESIPALGHAPQAVSGRAATCTEAGLSEGSKCSRCGATLKAQESIPALGHDWDGGKVTKEATVDAEGVRTYTCKRNSSHTKTESIPRLAPAPVTNPPVTNPPPVTDPPAHTHKWGDWFVEEKGTCVKKALLRRVCACGAEEYQYGGYGDHNWGEWHTVKEPTRTQPGTEERICKIESSHREEREIPPTGGANTVSSREVEEGSGKDLPGAYVQLRNEAGSVIDEWTSSGAARIIEGLEDGTYTVEETSAPEGYSAPAAFSFTVGETVSSTGPIGQSGDLLLINSKKPAKAELTIFLEARAKNPDEPKTEFHMYEKYKFHGYVENTGDVPLELYDCDMIVSNGWQSLGHTCDHKRYLLEPGEKVERWNGVWFIDLGGTIDSTTATPGTETAELYGTVTYSVQVPGYKPGTDEVLCTAAASSTIGVLKDDGPHPALYVECSWEPDAGEGKRYVDATVPVRFKVTNTGDCTLYRPAYLGKATDIVFPNVVTDIPKMGETVAIIEPGESWAYTSHKIVTEIFVEKGRLDYQGLDYACYKDAEGKYPVVTSNKFPINIPLTYPDGVIPEEDKPGIKLTGFQLTPEKEAYVDTHYLIDDNYIECDFIVTNTGNVPLRLRLNPKYGTCSYKEAIWGYGVVLNPGESWDYGYGGDRTYYYIGDWDGYIPPDAADSPYIGTYSVSFKVYGYAVDDEDRTTPICEDGPVTFTHNIVKPGGETGPELGDSQMTVLAEEMVHTHADPAGYQLGEDWGAWVSTHNTGPVTISNDTLHIDFTAADEHMNSIADATDGITWMEWKNAETIPDAGHWYFLYGTITEEDVARGYIEVIGHVIWTDPDTGTERIAYSNLLHLPVISKTGLVLTKGASDPENGEYFLEGEPIKWSLDVTNNSKEDVTDITVNDLGVNVGAFAKLAAGETQPVTVPDHTVTAYEAEVVGYVTNYATATGKDLAGIEHTWPSNPAKALTKPEIPPVGPGGGTDPLGPIYGVHPAVSIQKTDPAGPPDGVSYKEGEEAVFAITVVNTGDCVLKDLRLYDSLAGFAPIATLDALAPAESHVFEYRYTVTGPNADHGFAINSATLTYTFLDGIPGTPMPSNKCKILCGDNPDVTGGGIPAFDPDILHPDGPGLTPVTGPDGTPITGPGGTPIYAPTGTTPVLDPDGHPVTFPGGIFPGPDGMPIVIPAGCPVLLLPDGTHCIITPYGPILCDEDGNPILDADGHLIFLDWSDLDVSCQLRLDALGDGEGRYTLHACAAHAALALAAEDAVLNGDSASPIWRAELNNLYELLFTAASDEAKADLLWEREQYLAYVDALEAFAGEEAAAEALRLKVAELCCMIHTFPDALPGSLAGSYAQMLGAAEADASSREIGPMTGSDAPVTETYAGFARRALADTLSLLHSAKSYDADDVFFRGQSLWQIALDSQVNLLYKDADRDARKRIAAWRIALDSVVNAERPFLSLLYAENPAVAEEVLMNLYKTSALEERLN
ncbi:MAG: hypothetical protein K5919_07995 [Clostridiales bacterium]|nr:hypothetical protein [Clostridiales bacterium]